MLHEILFALLGHTGSIIIELPVLEQIEFTKNLLSQAENGEYQNRQLRFMVNPNLSFLSRAEVEQLNKIVQLGAYYKMIQQFLRKFSGISSKLALQLAYKEDNKPDDNDVESDVNSSAGGGPSDQDDEQDAEEEALQGVYLKAFCSGVKEILQVYKEHLLSIEHEYLKDRTLTIASLQLRLSLYSQSFPALTQLMSDIQDQGLRGGQLLDALHQRCTSGNPVIKNMFSRILFNCHKVFFHQINAWVVHGSLVDICEEFFIHKFEN